MYRLNPNQLQVIITVVSWTTTSMISTQTQGPSGKNFLTRITITLEMLSNSFKLFSAVSIVADLGLHPE